MSTPYDRWCSLYRRNSTFPTFGDWIKDNYCNYTSEELEFEKIGWRKNPVVVPLLINLISIRKKEELIKLWIEK